ncbi:2-C-methyl-D-erythritol 4-phosphate cytidylyltransferase, partial [bacterium]|nr:2-C-methyl-D-erythritol 4-phosphate cytidylyltransferase [bacterium]
MKSNLNKMFLEINGVPILYWTLLRLNKCRLVGRIILVSREQEIQKVKEMINKFGRLLKLKKIIEGGMERSDSVRNGLKYILENPESSIIMTHDGARPFFTNAMILRLKEATVSTGASIPVLGINETTRREIAKDMAEVIDRNSLFITQTP